MAPGARRRAAGALVTIAAHPNRTVEQLRAPLGLSQPGAARLVQRLLDPLGEDERQGLAATLGRLLAARTDDLVSAKHLCRLCERRACASCPVAAAVVTPRRAPA